jgi:hypothetical protein
MEGLFCDPARLRLWNKSAAKLLERGCFHDPRHRRTKCSLSGRSEHAPGCSIKGKFAVRAKLTGHRGIYHLESCGSYQRTKKPNVGFVLRGCSGSGFSARRLPAARDVHRRTRSIRECGTSNPPLGGTAVSSSPARTPRRPRARAHHRAMPGAVDRRADACGPARATCCGGSRTCSPPARPRRRR